MKSSLNIILIELELNIKIMRTKMIYQGRDESGYCVCNFVINGKGDFGNEESWNNDECKTAVNLANYIEQYTFGRSGMALFEGDTVYFANDNEYGITEWKNDIVDAYRAWKSLRKL